MSHLDFDIELPESAPVSQRVTQAVADATNTDPLELEPLFEVINPESLNALFKPTKSGSPRDSGMVMFDYGGCDVRVHADGSVEVAEGELQTSVQVETASGD
ncbi:HalOD1 output domain-containing protein [Natrinema sp. 1APR25-10V2]|uniref:HalOD1 output domain-containing protein n=1 Tax=Natrinema sp. 1APR25-10V2 TaxID=2951081 RepID=UPI002874D92D|nr:HalOD1 output domain-containing protein [Natrinema sp. 1APR25-10V2]MDS0474668.1 hypothetical protein [Natrinema sp. 1APR25-10V2]